ncbi:MAG: peptidoglycan-binding protein [Clostridia bacterium]|nr:peptidoglycan-binding protein [Clostridia bacterium]
MSSILDNDITTDRRPYVLELQTYLRGLQRATTGTTTVPRDGFFGTATAEGVEAFQRAYGLPATGRADQPTWDAVVLAYETLRLATARPLPIPGLRKPLLTPGDRGDDVAFLLIMLDALGARYNNIPPQTADAEYTIQTAEAIRAVQTVAGLPVTGETDKPTWNAVVRLYSDLMVGDRQ